MNSDLDNQLALHAASLEPRDALACVLKLQLGLGDNLDRAISDPLHDLLTIRNRVLDLNSQKAVM